MSIKSIAHRYAKALFDQSVEMKLEEVVEKDFSTMAETFQASPDLRRLFYNPIIESSRKKSVTVELFKDRLSALTMSFILLMINKGRESLTIPIITEFENLLDEQRNILRVEVTSAKPLDDSSRQQIETSLQTMTKKNIRAAYLENAALIGGLSIRIGDKVYDGSLRRQLEHLRSKLASV